MIKKVTVDGNEACARTSYYFTEIAGIYPITPSSPMAEHIDEWSSKGITNLFGDQVKVVEMQSEGGAAGMVHGSLQAGCLTSTYTASQGLLLMIPNMYKMAGEMLPCVMHVAARALSTHALSIFGDHQDIYAARSTGFCMLASSSVQDAAYLSAVAHLSAIKASLPFMHFFDGFRTSHELSKIEVLEKSDFKEMIDEEALNQFRGKALNPLNPVIRGTAENDDIYFQMTEVRNKDYDIVPEIVNRYMIMLNQKAGTNYEPFMYYGDEKADKLIVAMGSVCETIKETIDVLNRSGYHVGLLEVHLYRPFSQDYFCKNLPITIKKIAVLDRTKEAGSNGEPLYLDVVNALKEKDILIVGGRYGLSSKNTTPSMIKAVYDMLEENPKNNFTIGIIDDLTHLSLPEDSAFKIKKNREFLIYGYGSDGMVSASKSIIKLIGENTEEYVQGYFEYDSKKSGGVTASHLRFSKEPIRSTYYVENPSVVVVTKENYLHNFSVLDQIEENGVFLINTSKTKEEIVEFLPDEVKQILVERHIKCYMINAYELARKVGLQNKISSILEAAIIKISNLLDYDLAKEKMKEYANNKFFKKGKNILESNYIAIEEAENYIVEFELVNVNSKTTLKDDIHDVYMMMTKRLGNELTTSDMLPYKDGSFIPGTASEEKRAISEVVPRWIKDNCIECNQCSFVCPHGVIRPFLLSEEEFKKAPEQVKNYCKKAVGNSYYFALAISSKDCTGCGVCLKTCPGKKGMKALETIKLDKSLKEHTQEVFNYLVKNVTVKQEEIKSTIKGTQFASPRFAFSGACAGCGETAYIKLLTQLFGESLVIANATGCSSIYGGSMPSMPYTVAWASSLFEDNAEYSYGMLAAFQTIQKRLMKQMKALIEENNVNKELLQEYLNHSNNYEITKKIYQSLDYESLPSEFKVLKDYLPARTHFATGGDGWAYDIGFSGIDHVLASNDNINILVLDSQVYSNTGGQSSKASPKGAIASFASGGKKTSKKDLARIALSYPNAYVAQVSLGANGMQLIKALKEAVEHQGPSIIIAYTPCISHGIKGGMENSVEMEKMATMSGYFPIFRYLPETDTFHLDSKNVDFDLYEEFLMKQTRYAMLEVINPKHAKELLESQKEEAMKRYEYYKSLEKNHE
ncbi:MAG: pyruvate:ferredoxin (flavodoxin) oxidoreductase [Bacilli bacterium]|nr:pyruvate:ferredoxin (flavodoxin) oxidoreductase [Bacilli bacterium]